MIKKRLRKGKIVICFIFIICAVKAQSGYDFRLPINYPLRLSGSFGELRSNHFHAGIDVKSSAGASGDSLFSIQDGYVSRIMVHPSGYGNALTIDHPNGMTSVFAHLDRFEPSLLKLINKYQTAEQSYIIDFHIAPDEFPVKKGQLIGFMGSTGYSFGPHLHFEIKRTDSEMLLNPLLFEFPNVDRVPPEMHILRAYGWDHKRRETYAKNYNVNKKNGHYGIYGDTIRVPADRASLALSTIDKADGLHHRNGIHRIEMFVNDSLYFSYQMDSFLREDRRALNAHTDFEQYMFYGNWFHRLHRLPGNMLTLYPYIRNDGLIPLRKGLVYEVKIFVYDYNKNYSICTVYLTRDEETDVFKMPDSYYLLAHQEENLVQNGDLEVFFPKQSIYEDIYFTLFEQKGPSWSVFSKYYRLHTNRTPIHHPIEVRIKPDSMSTLFKDKAFLAHCVGSRTYNHGGSWDGEFFKGPTHQFGDFCIMVDTIPPVIRATSFSAVVRRQKEFRFTISDNFSMSRHIPSLHVEAYINENWVLCEYSSRAGLLQVPIDDLAPGQYQLRIRATDPLQNVRTWEKGFEKRA